MMTPIDAVRLHSTFGDVDFWPRAEERFSSSKQDDQERLAPARGAILGLTLGGLLWVGLIVGFRAIVGL